MSFYPPSITEILCGLRHCGPVSGDASFTAADFACGAFVRMSVSVDPRTNTIMEIGFSSNCCGYGVTAAETFCRELSGLSLAELSGLLPSTLEDLLRKSVDIPDSRDHCLQTAIEAIHGVFAVYRQFRVDAFSGDDPLICSCFGVSELTIERAIREGDLRSVDSVTEACRAGGGCGSCRMLIQEMIDHVSTS